MQQWRAVCDPPSGCVLGPCLQSFWGDTGIEHYVAREGWESSEMSLVSLTDLKRQCDQVQVVLRQVGALKSELSSIAGA